MKSHAQPGQPDPATYKTGYFGLLRTCNRIYRKGAETRVSFWVLGGRKSDALTGPHPPLPPGDGRRRTSG